VSAIAGTIDSDIEITHEVSGKKGDPNRLKKVKTEKVFEGIQFVFSCY